MIDTAADRRLASGVPFLPLGPGVTPDAAKGAKWRAGVAWSFAFGDDVDPEPEPTPVILGRRSKPITSTAIRASDPVFSRSNLPSGSRSNSASHRRPSPSSPRRPRQ